MREGEVKVYECFGTELRKLRTSYDNRRRTVRSSIDGDGTTIMVRGFESVNEVSVKRTITLRRGSRRRREVRE